MFVRGMDFLPINIHLQHLGVESGDLHGRSMIQYSVLLGGGGVSGRGWLPNGSPGPVPAVAPSQ